MFKKVISMLLSLCIIAPGATVFAANTQESVKKDSSTIYWLDEKKFSAIKEQKDENLIKDVIHSYFEKNFESIKNNSDEKYDTIIRNSTLKEYVELENKYLLKLNRGLNKTLESYNFNIEYNDININEMAIVDLNLNYESIYTENLEKVVVNNNINHIIVLKKYDNNWYIESDIYDLFGNANKEKINDENYNEKLLDVVKNAYANVDEKIKGLNEVCNIESKEKNIDNKIEVGSARRETYYPNVAVSYARKWAIGHNPDFPYFGNVFLYADCANFVSQCINYGGIGRNDSFNIGTSSWIEVNAQRNYLVGNGYAEAEDYHVGKIGTMSFYAKVGDIVQLYNTLDGTFTHDTIVSEKTNYMGDDVNICAHTRDRKDESLRKILAEPGNEQYTWLRLLSMR